MGVVRAAARCEFTCPECATVTKEKGSCSFVIMEPDTIINLLVRGVREDEVRRPRDAPAARRPSPRGNRLAASGVRWRPVALEGCGAVGGDGAGVGLQGRWGHSPRAQCAGSVAARSD